MAEFNVSDVASRINPPQQMSIGDMLNIARGAQAYKQAEQVNPLLVQQQQAETELAQKTLQPKIEQQGYITKQAETATEKSKFNFTQENAQAIQDEQNALLSDPRIKSAEDTVEGRQNAVSALLEAKKRALKKGVDEHLLEAITAPSISMASTTPSKLYQELLNSSRAGIGAVGQSELATPDVITNAAGQLVVKDKATGAISELPQIHAKKANVANPELPINLNPTSTEVARNTGSVTAHLANEKDYESNLQSRVEASGNQLMRTHELRELKQNFKPGAGTQTYANIASKLQALGAPQGLVDKIAGGNLSDVQSFNKFLAQSVIAGVRQSSGGDPARVAEVENYIKNNPTVNTDPRALDRLLDFTDKLANKDFAEQAFLTRQQKLGKYNPETHFGEAQEFLRSSGYIPKTSENKQANAKPSDTQKQNVPTSGSHGKVIAQAVKNGITYYRYEDGHESAK